MHFRKTRGFTLIELLIVVAIIAILAAIAVPNFLEAQVRAKVSRVKSDMRASATAIESYIIDWNVYPPAFEAHDQANWASGGAISSPPFHSRLPSLITTPIAYLTSIPNDPFRQNVDMLTGYLQQFEDRFVYFNFEFFRTNPGTAGSFMGGNFDHASELAGEWLEYSVGPDSDEFNGGPNRRVYIDYDPTNGTISLGNVFKTQAQGSGLGTDIYFYQ